MAMVILRERIRGLAIVGVVAALLAIVLFSVSGDSAKVATGPWLLLALVVMVAWGVQAFFMRKAALVGVNDATTFAWMTISGLLLVPVAFADDGRLPRRRAVAGPGADRWAPSCSTRSARCSW